MTTRISMSCNLPPQGLLVLMPSSQVMSVTQLAQMTVQFAIDNGTGTGNGKFIMLKLKQLSIKHGKTIAYAKYIHREQQASEHRHSTSTSVESGIAASDKALDARE